MALHLDGVQLTRAKKRRQYRTGSVYRRASDGLWIGTIDAGTNASGKRRRITVSAHSEAAAKDKLKARQIQLDAEGHTDVRASTTVKAWSETWLAEHVQPKARPATYDGHSSAVRRWIVPVLGRKRLDALSPADVRAVAKAQREAGNKSSSMARTHAALMAMLKAARAEGHAVPVRVLEVAGPTPGKSDSDAMTIAEALTVLATAAGDEVRVEYPWLFSRWLGAILHGWRPAEARGLTWPMLDLDRGLVEVAWQLQPLRYLDNRDKARGFRVPDGYDVRHLEGAFHLTRPKTAGGFRMAPLVPGLVDALLAWREIAPDNPHDLVWPRPDGKPMPDPYDRDAWHELQRRAGVAHPDGRPYKLVEARHTTATQLMELGYDPTQIAAIMGHSSVLSQQAYKHPSRLGSLDALAAVAERLELG